MATSTPVSARFTVAIWSASPGIFSSFGWSTGILRADRANARTECPARRAAFTVSRPIPLLAPMIRTIATAWMLLKDQRNGSTESLARSIGLVHGRIPWPEYFTLFLGFPYWFGKRETRRSREELARSRRHIERHAPRMIKPHGACARWIFPTIYVHA